MKILVTGANGFVGRALVAHLQKQHEVVPAVRETVGDIGPATEWAAHLVGIDTVVHLAARVHVLQDQAADPLAVYRHVNRDGTRRLAEQAVQAGVRRLVFLSSVKVHGEFTQPGQAWTENSPCLPQDPYGISKLEAEQALANTAGLAYVVLRSPLVYGPGVGANFATLVRAVQRGLPLPLARIKNKRSLVALANLVHAIELAVTHPAAAHETFLVSDQHDLSSADLIRHIAHTLGRSPRLWPCPASLLKRITTAAIYQRLCADLALDTQKISDLLSYHPVQSIEQAMRDAISPLLR